MSTFGFHLDGYTILRLGAEHAADVQDLYERCSDYHELHEGIPTRPTAGEQELAALPPGKSIADKYLFGVYSAPGMLVGVVDLVRDFPEARVWALGLMLLDPVERGSGLGARLYGAAVRLAVGQGARTVEIGVLEENPRAARFWRSQGFREVRRQPHLSATGHRCRHIVLRHEISTGDE